MVSQYPAKARGLGGVCPGLCSLSGGSCSDFALTGKGERWTGCIPTSRLVCQAPREKNGARFSGWSLSRSLSTLEEEAFGRIRKENLWLSSGPELPSVWPPPGIARSREERHDPSSLVFPDPSMWWPPCFLEPEFHLATSPAVLRSCWASCRKHSTLLASFPNLSCFYFLLLSFP